MPFKIDVLPDSPIVIHTHEPSPDMVTEIPEAMRTLAELLSAQPRPVYLVLDLTGVTMTLDDLMKTSSDATRGPGALLHHPNVAETLFVLTNSFMKLGTMGLTSEAFGHAKVRVFDTLEQALAYAQERIAQEAQG